MDTKYKIDMVFLESQKTPTLLEQRTQVSQQPWLPSSSCHAEGWGSEEIARGWGTCRRWSSGAEVHGKFKLQVDHTCEERLAKRRKVDTRSLALKAKRFRLCPTAEEKQILLKCKWIGTSRWTYNECLRAIQDEGVPKSKKALRARAINKEAARDAQKARARTRRIRSRLRCGTSLGKSASRRALSSAASTGRAAVGSTRLSSAY
ncbi:hypothetical protein V1506DRAFT_553507 [Lipomyces tetrasporus]